MRALQHSAYVSITIFIHFCMQRKNNENIPVLLVIGMLHTCRFIGILDTHRWTWRFQYYALVIPPCNLVRYIILEFEFDWLFNITCNDIISVIYVTAHRCAGGMKKKFDLRSGSHSNRHFVGFSNVSVQAPTQGHPFYTLLPRNHPI